MSLPLSGQFDTAQLPKVAPDPVTVTVARSITPGHEAQYLKWADEVVTEVRAFHGCLGAGVLQPGPDGGEYQIVFRFVDGVHLRQWEKSPQRAALMERGGSFIEGERVQTTVGVDNWFEMPERAEPKRPLWKRIVLDVAWVYPVAIASSLWLAPRLDALPLELRVTVSTLLITVAMRMAVGPLRSKLRSRRSL